MIKSHMYVYFLKAREKLYMVIYLDFVSDFSFWYKQTVSNERLRALVDATKDLIYYQGNMLETPLAYDISASRAAKEKIKKAN